MSDATVEDWGITKEDYLPCPVDVQDGFLLISFVPCNLTQLTPIRALSQAPREVMKYGSGEICNALLSGLGYNGVHANYACRLPPAPGRRTTQRAPGLRPGLAEERRPGGGSREERGGGERSGVWSGGRRTRGGGRGTGKREKVGGRSRTQEGVEREGGGAQGGG